MAGGKEGVGGGGERREGLGGGRWRARGGREGGGRGSSAYLIHAYTHSRGGAQLRLQCKAGFLQESGQVGRPLCNLVAAVGGSIHKQLHLKGGQVQTDQTLTVRSMGMRVFVTLCV